MNPKLSAWWLLALLQFAAIPLYSQTAQPYQIPLKTAALAPTGSIDNTTVQRLNKELAKGTVAAILQWETLPSLARQKTLELNGIHFLNYLGGNAYLVSMQKTLEPSVLKRAGIRTVVPLQPEQKLHPALQPPAEAPPVVQALLFSFSTKEAAVAQLEKNGFEVNTTTHGDPVLEIKLPAGRLLSLAALPFIQYIEPLPGPLQDLNNNSLAGTSASLLHAAPYGLTGEGVTFQINEFGGYPQGHPDFIARSVLGQTQSFSNYHSTHVHGIAAGAGIIDERMTGYAPKARFISELPFISTVPANVLAHGVDLTNNSYGSGVGCTPRTGINSINAFVIDKQAIDFTHLLHVFAAGNYASQSCPGYPTGYNTIDRNSQTAKSVLTVGATSVTGQLSAISSRGPVTGGRIKPEITAPGEQIWSTVPNNTYYTNSGTSMAAPAVMGGLALLYQRYRQTHNGSKPPNALMKALICNTATDKGTPGPDYSYGFGFMNLARALQVLDKQHYFAGTAGQGQTNTETITIPPGTAQLKIMLYWMDRPASPLTAKMIINDLDLAVTTPVNERVLPYILDTVPSQVANPARRGEDHINNIEQVVINDPQAGTYTIEVKGYELGEGPQPYFLVYDMLPDTVELTFPAKGQSFAPGDALRVQWDNWGGPASAYRLDFSPDNGATWNQVATGIPAGSTGYDGTVPNHMTGEALFRLTRTGDGKTTFAGPFTIIGVPGLKLQSSQCPGAVALEWTPVAGATAYEVMQYRNGEMQTVATTTQTTFLFSNLPEDSTHWFSVRARYREYAGRRAVALSRKPDSGNCAAPAHNNDLKLEALEGPVFGRRFTSQQLGRENLRVRITNRDDAPATGFTLSYAINGSTWKSETADTTIPPNSSISYTLKSTVDFSAAGNYTMNLALSHPGDPNTVNDSLAFVVRHLPNDPVHPAAGVREDMEAAPEQDYAASTRGLEGLHRFDYTKQAPTEKLRVGSHYAQHSSKALELVHQTDGTGAGPGQQALVATYNLSAFDTATHNLGLDFTFVHLSPSMLSFDSLLVRGSDTAAWILVENLLQGAQNGVRQVEGLALADSLRAHGQNLSSSFQLKWAPTATTGAVLLDNIELYNSTNDLALVSIDSLLPANCGLTATTPIRITIHNRAKTAVNNLTVRYKVNNGAMITETVPFVAAQSFLPFTFQQKADLSGLGRHTVEAWLEHPGDTYAANNSKQVTFRNLPLVNSFPALQDFEGSDGGWFAEGTNSSWQWGTPASERIRGAASGSKAWKTNLQGSHNPNERSFLYTDCYDLSSLARPVISVSTALNIDSCGSPAFCDLAIFQYSTNGKDWRTIPPRQVYNWPQQIVATGYHRWHVMSQRLPDTVKTVRFRFQFRTDGYNTFDGVGIDDFHIYDSTAMIHEGPSVEVKQSPSNPNQWLELRSEGKLLAAVHPQGQNPGEIRLQTFSNNAAARNFHGQYYYDRNFLLSASQPLADSVTLRLYMTDKEVDRLLFANNCHDCTKPANAFRFGLSTYITEEPGEADSTISNNRTGHWAFIPNSRLTTVPFANGYYIETKILLKDFTEIRLCNGGWDGRTNLPVYPRELTASQESDGTRLQWQTGAEINIHDFVIEVARGNKAFQNSEFEKIGEQPAKGRSATVQSYAYTDGTSGKTGVWYYRLKTRDDYGNYTISETIPVHYSDNPEWQVYPNPSGGLFTLAYQYKTGATLNVKMYNAVGIKVKETTFKTNGFLQQAEINLGAALYAPGTYYLELSVGQHRKVIRWVKQ